MPKTDDELIAEAQVIANETQFRHNTKERIAQMFIDVILNKPNFQNPPAQYNSNTLLSDEDVIEADCSGGNLNFTLPDATTNNGKEFTLVKVDASSNTMNLLTLNVQTISGQSTKSVDTQWSGFRVKSNGVNYTVINNI